MEREGTVNSLQLKKRGQQTFENKMDIFKERRQGSYQECFAKIPQKIVSVPTQQYYNGAYMEETVHDLTTKTRQRKNL